MLRHLRQIRPLLQQQRSYNNIGSTVAPDATRAKALQRYGRNLEVQALVVDAQIFRRKGGAPLQASALAFDSSRKVAGGQQVASKEMLTKAVREELRARGLDAIGKPWVVRERLDQARSEAAELETLENSLGVETAPADAARGASASTVLASGAPSDQPDASAAPDPPDAIAGGIAAKYAAKLAAKRGDGAPATPTPGDADLLSSAKALVEAADAQRNNEESSRWRMGPPGLKGLLTHASRRSMALAVVARPDTTPRELADLTSQAGVAFDVVVEGEGGIDAAVDQLGLAPHRVLAFVDDTTLLREAKRRELRTVQFVGENEELPVRRDRRPDYDVSACADVVGVIDELNGLSFRGGSAM